MGGASDGRGLRLSSISLDFVTAWCMATEVKPSTGTPVGTGVVGAGYTVCSRICSQSRITWADSAAYAERSSAVWATPEAGVVVRATTGAVRTSVVVMAHRRLLTFMGDLPIASEPEWRG